VLVRAPLAEDDPTPRLVFVRQRPGGSIDGGPLTGKEISHRQLLFRRTRGGWEVENIGKAVLLVDGERVEQGKTCPVRPGAILLLPGHSVFLLIERPLTLPPLDSDAPPVHDFGEADADGIVGESPAIWKLRSDLTAALRTAKHVLVNGLSGTGKELVAQAIHPRSASAR
jgi:hypothetical protein